MNDPLFEDFVRELRNTIGPYQVVVRPLLASDDPEVADFAWILGVPDTVRKESRKAAFEVLVRVYGDAHVPFHLGIASREEAENRFGDVYKRTA